MAGTTIIKNDNDKFERLPVNSRKLSRTPSVAQDVEVPLRAGLSAAGFTFMCFIGWLLYKEQTPTMSYIGIAIMVCTVIGFLFFIWRIKFMESIVWDLERVVGSDMDHDGFIGEPAHPVLVNNGNKNNKFDPALEWQHRFNQYLDFVFFNGLEHHLARKEFSEFEIITFRSYLIQLNICKWKNPKNHNTGIEFVLEYDDAVELVKRTPWIDIDKKVKMK